jgi:N-glycosidase YbiA
MPKTLPLEIFYIYFSPYTAHAIEKDGRVYPTVEHAYQCQRYKDKKIIEEIISARSSVKAWEVSTKYKHLQIPEFKDENYKLKVMKEIMLLKAKQHEDVRRALIDSGDLKIVKHIVTYPPGDGFWDDGEDGKGLNHIGTIWTEIREEIDGNNSMV